MKTIRDIGMCLVAFLSMLCFVQAKQCVDLPSEKYKYNQMSNDY
jgi:hypothetical protein